VALSPLTQLTRSVRALKTDLRSHVVFLFFKSARLHGVLAAFRSDYHRTPFRIWRFPLVPG
jgi:hypothetical protein